MALIQNFRDIDQLSPTDFEFFVRDVFETAGWEDLVVTLPGSEFRHGDGGVDIFGRRGSRRFAIEVKHRSLQDKVDVQALNQLVTGAKLSKVENLILVTNSYFTTEVRTRALRLGVELVDRDALKTLWYERRSDIGNRIRPHKHQEAVLEEVLSAVQKGKRRFLIEMATGLGKTYTAAHIVRRLRDELVQGRSPRVLFLAHQVELLLQAVTAFKNVLGIGDYSYSACFDGAEPEDTDVVFGSFDTLVSRLGALRPDAFDIIIVDEAHHAAATTYSLVVEHFQPRLLLGLTATPYRTDARDIFRFFGGEEGHIGRFDLCWALKNRKLAFPRYRVFLDDIDPQVLQQFKLGMNISDIDRRLFLHKKDEEIVRIIEKVIADQVVEEPKAIVFCRSIRHLKHLIQFFPQGSATLVHSKMSAGDRRSNIRAFREGDFRYILVCDLFNEGIDIPETNVLVFLRYTGSKIIWLQQLGRGLRKTAKKHYVHVLDFVGSLDRLQEIEALGRDIAKAPLDDDVREPDATEVFHDSTFKVHYDQSAAQVLGLLEDLQYRLLSRNVALQSIRAYREQHQSIPPIDKLEAALKNVSADQVATHFGSYISYLDAALGDSYDRTFIRDACIAYVKTFKEMTHGTLPSLRAISLGTEVLGLPLVTDEEAKALIGDDWAKREDEATPSVDESQACESSIGTKDSVNRAALDVEPQCGRLLARYVDTVSTLEHLKALPSSEIEAIQREHRSLFGFLRSLEKVRAQRKVQQ